MVAMDSVMKVVSAAGARGYRLVETPADAPADTLGVFARTSRRGDALHEDLYCLTRTDGEYEMRYWRPA